MKKEESQAILKNISKVKREKLGKSIPIEIFRVFRHFSQIYAEELLGEKAKNILFVNAGKELGLTVGENLYNRSFERYIDNVKKFLKDKKIGILDITEISENKLVFQLDECITCSGMDNIGKRICFFEVGLVAGIVEAYFGKSKKVLAKETKCNANGEGICEVSVYIT